MQDLDTLKSSGHTVLELLSEAEKVPIRPQVRVSWAIEKRTGFSRNEERKRGECQTGRL